MRIESSRYTERFGSVRINEVQSVLELDSGRATDSPPTKNIAVQKIEEDVIKDFEGKMAVAVPVMNEKLKLFEGVISGVPHDCLIIVVSNSRRKRIDRFKMERESLELFCHFTQRQAVIIHQKDPILAQALVKAGYTDMLGEDGLVRSGKAEGMMVAMLLAMATNKEYIGFVDADNYFPGAVWEYVRCFSSGLSMAPSPYAMIRIQWRYKPKAAAGMFFKKWGRVSEVTNKCMNALIANKTGFETEIIKTGNAGEHAMSLRLAEFLPYASGYAVEPQELVSIFEGFGGFLPIARGAPAKHGVDILQIETRNPHLHEEKGFQHLKKEMLLPGIGTIYHSPLCEEATRKLVLDELLKAGVIKSEEEPPRPHIMAPLKNIDLPKFKEAMAEHMNSYWVLEGK
ncbi:MAG: mannosyl-3-phosphoglycerate synthase [Chloroflexota bacterium]|nr:mannosyl-3-phosphoglycerate synthase [Chloroflexota bacterium]